MVARVLMTDFVIDGLRATTSLEDLTWRVAAATGIEGCSKVEARRF